MFRTGLKCLYCAPKKGETMTKPIIAIVGRPNTGKSMLFNKIAGRRLSIVEDVPGRNKRPAVRGVRLERQVIYADRHRRHRTRYGRSDPALHAGAGANCNRQCHGDRVSLRSADRDYRFRPRGGKYFTSVPQAGGACGQQGGFHRSNGPRCL